eukprot:COSAG01_NODE_43651_length_427_cov_2.606707_1_plen_58_part_10
MPAQGKECFSTGRASSARDQSRSPPILEDYRSSVHVASYGGCSWLLPGCRSLGNSVGS